MGLPDGRKSFKIGLAVLIQYWHVTNSQPRRRNIYALCISASCSKNELRDKIKDVMHVSGRKQFLHRGSNEIFVASINKICTFNKDSLDSEWALSPVRFVMDNYYQRATSRFASEIGCALRLICI